MKISDQDIKFAASTVDEQIDTLSEVHDAELRPSSLNARVVHDLYQVYDHASYSRQLERSLEHIGQRLESKRVQSVETVQQQTSSTSAIVTTAQTGEPAKRKNNRASRSPIFSRLASLAAVVFVALLVGSLLLTLQATRHHASETVGKSEPQIVSVKMGPASFLTSSVILRAGMSLQLVNDTSIVHIIDNGYWDENGQKNLLHEPGMPKSPIYFGAIHETHLIGPFQTLGTYHLFDEIHENMNLTIYVKSSGTPGGVTPTPAEYVLLVHLQQLAFQPSTITIRKGTSLALANDNPLEEHIIMNGYWKDGHAVYIAARGKPVPAQVLLNLQHDPTAQIEYIDGQGVPMGNAVIRPGYPVMVIGGFMKAGTYSFFDPLHVGMNLTVVVQ